MDIHHLQNLKSIRPTYKERVDIRNIKTDIDSSVGERAEEFLRQIRNPYAFRCGEVAVNVEFCPEGRLLKEAITSFLSVQKKTAETN